MELSMKMKYFVFLLGASTLTFAIQVPSSWQQDEKYERSRYREIRPPRHDNQIQRKNSNGIDQTNDRSYSRPKSLLTKSSSPPVTKNNWATVIHKMPKNKKNNKKLVKQKYINNVYPYKGSELKDSISGKPFRPSIPERVHLEFYMTPKTIQHNPFNNPQSPRNQLPFHVTPDRLPQNIFSTPQHQLNFDPFVSTQPDISNEKFTRPNTFASFTNKVPVSLDDDQVFNPFENRKSQSEHLHQQYDNLTRFTTSVPPYQNFDQHFNIPPNYKSVELFQNPKINNNPYNNNDDSKSSNPFVIPDKYPRADNQYSFTTSQNVGRNINNAKTHKSVEPFQNRRFENHLYKNYRDDKTHEPIDFDPFPEQDHIPAVEREEYEKSPISIHEYPAEVPTKPIYPGPGQWAKPGIRHSPFISKQKYDNLEESEEKPDGYDTFEEGESFFNKLNGKFEKNLNNFPEKHNLGQFLDNKTSNSNRYRSENEKKTSKSEDLHGHEREDTDEKEEEVFVPTRLYAQVRRSEGVQHLPADKAEEPNLRESIKESKIQTVYTEEGYDDSAYDHAGHEKKAENEEGFVELDKAKERIEVKKLPDPKYNLHIKPKYELVEYGDENDLPTDEEIEQYKREELGLEDSDSDGSQSGVSPNLTGEEEDDETEFKIPDKRTMKSNNNFISTKEEKTMTTRENDNGDTETEISSRVKMILQPNNHTKPHEFVKIHPKIYSSTIGRLHNKSVADEETIAKVEELPFEPKQMKSDGIYIEEILSTTTDIPVTTVPTSEYTVMFTEEIPITTLATTAIPSIRDSTSKKEITESLESIDKAFWGMESRSRRKRFINDFPKITVDTEFISKINHDLGKSQEDSHNSKYPYYVQSGDDEINENSPLRYSENLKNIPLKKEGNMAFYEQADSMTVCPEIDTMIDPIPERIQNANRKGGEPEEDYDEDEEGETEERDGNVTQNSTGLPEQPKSPRLTGLDDKINCLKAKYFGKNPLDSPFFAEETVGTVMPFFEILQNRKNVETLESNKTNSTVNNVIEEHEIFGASNYEDEYGQNAPESANISETMCSDKKICNGGKNVAATTDTPTTMNFEKLSEDVLNDVTKNMKAMIQTDDEKTPLVQTVPTISILTTPQYTIHLKPKHIYDQIQLLNHLPDKLNISNNHTRANGVQVVSNVQESLKEIGQEETMRKPRKNDEEEDTLTYDSSIASPSISENLTDDSSEGILPDAEALRRRKKFRSRRKRPLYRTNGMKRISSTTFQPIFGNHITASTVLPKYKVVSEVFYKDEIKPNEQLNVFTDILNNIRNSSQEAADALQNSSESETGTLMPKHRIDQSKWSEKYNRDSYLNAYSDQEIDNSYYASTVTSTTTTTVKPNVYRATMYDTKSFYDGIDNTHIRKDEDALDKYRLYIALLDAKKKQNYGSTITTSSPLHVTEYDIDSEFKTSKVMGLMPPGMHRYKTIHHPKRDNQNVFKNPGYMEKIGINNYLVMGMKPPPRQRVHSYTDFEEKNYNTIRRAPLRRGKRSTNQSSYAQLARNRGQDEHVDDTETDDDDDDYVPHRPKNFYYDEKTGKIVYNNIKKPEVESDEDIEYIEIIEETPKTTPKPKPKQNPIFATATPPPEGQSYIDFVKKLKSAPNYKLIPDPTTTERGAEVSTEKVTVTTSKSEPTKPPEFLSILGRVRQNSEYKFIEDKKDKEEVRIPSTEAPEKIAEIDEDEEILPINVKNSPGEVQHELHQGFQIFDISDYIPKLKNYLPRTSIDISKYKTLHRTTVTPVLKTESDSVKEVPQIPVSKISSDSEETENSQTSNSNNRPVFVHTTKVNDVTVSTNDEIAKKVEEENTSSPATTISTTVHRKQSPIIQNRRRRPTTMKSVLNTRRKIPSTSSPLLATLDTQTEHHPQLRKNFRRRPTRIRVTPMSENLGNDDIDDTTKVLRRRSNLYEHKANEIVKTPTTARSVTSRSRIEPKKYVDNLKKYSQNKRRGSIFGRNVGLETNTHQTLIESVSEENGKSRDVEVIGEYNKDEKHGGNYKREDVNFMVKDKKKEEAIEPKDEVMIINLLPKYRREDQTDSSGNVQVETSTAKLPNLIMNARSNKLKRIITNQKRPYSELNKPVQRLTDVVTKPETFYTDPTLPRSINLLMGIEALSSEEIGSISEAETSSEDFFSDKENSPLINTLKKPAYIEDPSKRLYYYAPI